MRIANMNDWPKTPHMPLPAHASDPTRFPLGLQEYFISGISKLHWVEEDEITARIPVIFIAGREGRCQPVSKTNDQSQKNIALQQLTFL